MLPRFVRNKINVDLHMSLGISKLPSAFFVWRVCKLEVLKCLDASYFYQNIVFNNNDFKDIF